jgi:hypothetical protein
VAVWIVWNQDGEMVARGASVTGVGAANVGAFNALQTIPGTASCTFGDIAIAPNGAVVQVCQTPVGGQGPSDILVNTDADGLGPNNFGAAVTVTATNVGTFDRIPAQNSRSIDSEAGLAFDNNAASPHFGRLYLVYTEETAPENSNTDILLRWSDDNGATWPGGPITVNDDGTTRSQFLPKIALNSDSGNVAICWYDARNSATNTAAQTFCAIANRDLFPAFIGANRQVSIGASTSTGTGNEFGDYGGLAYFMGVVHPIWADTSNSTGNNPGGTGSFDTYTNRVMGGAAANEGDPHITTVDGINYDFQAAGEFVSLRDGSGMEIQTRQTAISTSFFPGANAYTGIASCVSVNSAFAARVGKRRVTYEPNTSGVPDPSGMQLRVDGALTTLGASGLDLGNGGRVSKTSAPGGIRVDFPDGTILLATPGWWDEQQKYYLNVHVSQTPAVMGIMGVRAAGSWLPALPDGTSLGPKPAALSQRYTDLYQRFGGAWRVTDANTLFDYATGTSTATFTLDSWPTQSGPCIVPQTPVARPASLEVAERACRLITDKNRHDNCVFDVRVTGEAGFADTYLGTQQVIDANTGPAGSTNGGNTGNNNNNTSPGSPGKWALFLDLGAGIPHGTFANIADPGFSFNAGLEYMFTPQFSAEGIVGYHRLPGAFGGHFNLYQVSANAKTYFTAPPNQVRPFVNGGFGAYKFGSGSTHFGGNLGAGILYEVTPRFGLQGSYNFHIISASGFSPRYSTLQGGVRFRF